MKPSFVLRAVWRKCRHAERNGKRGNVREKSFACTEILEFFASSDCKVKSDLLQFISATKYSVLKYKQPGEIRTVSLYLYSSRKEKEFEDIKIQFINKIL